MTNAVAPTRAGQVRPKLDQICADAVDIARDAVTEDVAGPYIEAIAEGERLVTHYFECTMTGYRGWRWAVTVARTSRSKQVTICETVLLPGPDALTTPDWVPWNERVRAGDLGVGDLMPTSADDDRLVPGYLLSEDPAIDDVVWELGLGRVRVMSREGRLDAAERWYEGEHGPQAPIAVAAPANARCVSCGFFLPLAGSMSALFGACANLYAPDDGRVVSGDHGCGAHSEVLVEQTVEVDEAPTIYDDAEVEPVAVQVGPADVAAVELDALVADDVVTLTETPIEETEPAAFVAVDDVASPVVEELTLVAEDVEPAAEAFVPIEVDSESPQVIPVATDVGALVDESAAGESPQVVEDSTPVGTGFEGDVVAFDEIEPVASAFVSDAVETPAVEDAVEAFVPIESDRESEVAEAFAPVDGDSVDEVAPVAEAFVPVEDVSVGEVALVAESDGAEAFAPYADGSIDEVEPIAEAFAPVESDDSEPVAEAFVPVESDDSEPVAEAFVPASDDVEPGIVEESFETDDAVPSEVYDTDTVSGNVPVDVVDAESEPIAEAFTPAETNEPDAAPTVDELEAVVETFASADEIEPASLDASDYAVEPASYAEEPVAPSAFDLGSEVPAADADDASETLATTETFEQLAAVEPPVEQVEPEYPAPDAETPPAFDLGSDVSTDENRESTDRS